MMNFGQALTVLKGRGAVARKGWNGPNMWIKLQTSGMDNMMSLSYIYMSTVQGDLVPWLASQTDLLAEDWVSVEL